jgi:hypothetical protein
MFRNLIIFCLILAACGEGRLSPQGGTITGATPNGGLVVTSGKLGLLTCDDGEVPIRISGVWDCGTGTAITGTITGTGTPGQSVRWTGVSTQGDGAFTDDGTNASLPGILTTLGGISVDVSTDDLTPPDVEWIARNGHWIIGMDTVQATPVRDFVIAAKRGDFSCEDLVTTSGSAAITSAAECGFTTALIGKSITGTGIPGGTTIAAVSSATSATLSANATASSTIRATITDNTTTDIVYVKHRGGLASTVGIGYTPPPSTYRLAVAGSDSEAAMGELGVRVSAGQSGDAVRVFDSGGGGLLSVTKDGYIKGGASLDAVTLQPYSSTDPLVLSNAAGDNSFSFRYGGAHTGATAINFRNATTATNVWEAGAAGDFYVLHNAMVDGNTLIDGELDGKYSTNATASLDINKNGYQGGATQFRDVTMYDGKGATACTLTGSTKTLNCVGGLQVNGTSVVTTSSVSGTANTLAMFTATNVIGDSPLLYDGSSLLYTMKDIGEAKTSATSWQITTRSTPNTFPAVAMQPSTNNTVLALDLMPKGSPSVGTGGYAWFDVCDADLVANSSAAVHCARVGTGGIDAQALNGAVQQSLDLKVGGTNVITIASNLVTFVQPLSIAPTAGANSIFTGSVSTNGGVWGTITNTNASSGAYSKFELSNDGSTGVGTLFAFGTGYTTNGGLMQDSTVLYAGAGMSNGLNLVAAGAAAPMRFYTGGSTSGDLGCTLDINGVMDCVGLKVGGVAVGTVFSTNNVIPKGNGTGLTSSTLTDNGTTLTINTNKVTFTESNGNTAIAGTLGVDGTTTLGDTTSDATTVNGIATFNKAVGTAVGGSTPNIDLIDTTSAAQGVGGSLRFQGAYTGTTTTSFAEIKAYKTNGTGGNFSGDLVLATRPDGGSMTERMRIADTGAVKFGDATSGGIENNVDAVTISNTGTAQTTSAIKLLKLDGQSATFDLASSKVFYGAYIDIGAPGVSGCGAPCSGQFGNMQNVAIYANATDGEFADYALLAPNGRVWVGDSLKVGGGGLGLEAADDGDETITVASSPTGYTSDLTTLNASSAGTFDSTGGAISVIGADISITATRSAGAADVTNYGARLSASGGQANHALAIVNGDIIDTNGDVMIGDSFNVTGAVDFDSTLNVDGAATFNSTSGITNNGVKWIAGSNSPEGVVTAPVGSLYSRTNGGAGTSLYVKESGAGNTGWVGK